MGTWTSYKTASNCSNCNKPLMKGERQYSEFTGDNECAECRYLQLLNAREIPEYNKRLKKEQQDHAKDQS